MAVHRRLEGEDIMDEKMVSLQDEELNDVIGGAGGYWGDTVDAKPDFGPDKGYMWYHVTATDTLSGIASKFGTTVKDIQKKNNNILKGSTKIGPHYWLQIPKK